MSNSGTAGGSMPPSTTPSTPAPMIQRKGRNLTSVVAVEAVIIVVLIGLVAGYAGGWIKQSSTTSNAGIGCTLPAATPLVGTGSTLVAPLMDIWESFYRGGTVVNYNALGSTAGINAITAKTVDYGASDAPLNPTQRAGATGVLTVPESAGGVVPLYNLAGTGVTHLNFNGSLLAQIFSGVVTNWNNTALQALNPAAHLPNANITVVHRSDGSGTTFIFTSYLSLSSTTWNHTWGKGTGWPTNISDPIPQQGWAHNAGVTTYVVGNPDTIGYVDLNYALTSGASVSYGAVKNPSGTFVVANVTNTASALADSPAATHLPAASADWYNVSLLNAPGTHDYPISSLTYIFVYQNLSAAYPSYTLTKAENLVDFLHWITSPAGQQFATPLYYVPLPTAIQTSDNASLNSITFNGATMQACLPASTT